jgi:ABC-2 type transport system ATP-binding protein
MNVTKLVLALAREGCEVLSIQERNESLQTYYLSLVGGGET